MNLNEITLSNDLTKLAFEINGLKSNIGYSFYEIGRRLKIAKETNSGYGEWKKFLESINFSRTQADRLIVVFEEYSNGNLPDVGQIGLSLAYEIATLPEPQKKEQTQRIKEGENIPVREIQELKRQNKEQEKQLKEQSEQHQRQLAEKDEVINKTYEQLEKAQNQEPKKVIIEKAPDDYEKYKQEALNSKLYLDELNRIKHSYNLLETKYSLLESSTAEAKEMERKLKSMRAEEKSILDKMQAIDDFIELENEFNEFFDTKMAPMRFKGIANHLYATNAIERIKSMINQADLWVEEMNKLIPNSNIKIIEGEFTNE